MVKDPFVIAIAKEKGEAEMSTSFAIFGGRRVVGSEENTYLHSLALSF